MLRVQPWRALSRRCTQTLLQERQQQQLNGAFKWTTIQLMWIPMQWSRFNQVASPYKTFLLVILLLKSLHLMRRETWPHAAFTLKSEVSRFSLQMLQSDSFDAILVQHHILSETDWFRLITWRVNIHPRGDPISPHSSSLIFSRFWLV